MNDIKFKCIPVNCKSRPLNEASQELIDKMYGNPCTDMYYFEFLTLEECKEKGVTWECKSYKKKKYITDDQKIKKQRPQYTYDKEQRQKISDDIIAQLIQLNDMHKHLEEEIRTEIDKKIIEKLKGLAKGENNENKD